MYLIEILHQTTTELPVTAIPWLLYLIEILHQTTTVVLKLHRKRSCILSKFYIKPQPSRQCCLVYRSCILSKFYIKPQLDTVNSCKDYVVSYRNSTSNHNQSDEDPPGSHVVSYRNSTSNHNRTRNMPDDDPGCILSKFYIKPQQRKIKSMEQQVVSYRNSTSNHNGGAVILTGNLLYLIEILHQTTTLHHAGKERSALYLIEILHQTTTTRDGRNARIMLYLIEILHQTTTIGSVALLRVCCILSKFYIKPQLFGRRDPRPGRCILSKFYIKPQRCPSLGDRRNVVSYRNSTSNHNVARLWEIVEMLYLIEILHQTTTFLPASGTCPRLYLIEILHQTTTSGLILIDKVLLTGCLPL